MRKIAERLPFSLKIKWRETVDSIMQREKRDVNLKDITEFIETRARVTNHPIFGKISNDNKRMDPPPSSKRQSHHHVRNYATQGEQRPPRPSETTSKGKIRCPSCNANHWLSQCDKFKRIQNLFEQRNCASIALRRTISSEIVPKGRSVALKTAQQSIPPFSTRRIQITERKDRETKNLQRTRALRKRTLTM